MVYLDVCLKSLKVYLTLKKLVEKKNTLLVKKNNLKTLLKIKIKNQKIAKTHF
jgi:hypothetical protein